MAGPEQPDKTSDKSSSQSGKLEKSAGQKLSQDAFPPPPKEGQGGDSNKGTGGAPADKSATGTESKTADPGKGFPDKQDSGFSDKKSADSSPLPEKQPPKPPASDFGSQPPAEKPPSKPPPSDFGSQPQAEKLPPNPPHSDPGTQPLAEKQSFDSGKKPPPADGQFDNPPTQSGNVGLPQKDQTDASKKVPVADSPAAPRDSAPRSTHADSFNTETRPPADRATPRNANQDLPEKLPQKQSDGSRALDAKPNAPAPREERPAAAPAGSDTPRPQETRVAPRSGPEAGAQRAAERPGSEGAPARQPERYGEPPQARSADAAGRPEAQPARGADAARAPGTDRGRSAPPAGESGHLERANLNPRDNPAASRQGQPDVATARRGEAALAESLGRQQGQGAPGRGRETSEPSQDRSRHAAGPGRSGGDDARAESTARLQAARGPVDRAGGDSHVMGRTAAGADAGRGPARDAHPVSALGDGALRGSSENISKHVAADHTRSPELAQHVRPEMKALADMVGKSRSDQQDAAAIRAARADLQASRLPHSLDGQAVRGMIAGGERGQGDMARRLDERAAAGSAPGADRTAAGAHRPIDIPARTHDPGSKGDTTASGARPPDTAGTRQPGRAPSDIAAPQPGARPSVDAGGRQPDRVAADGQGQVRQPVKGAADDQPIRAPGTATADGKSTVLPPQRAGSDAITEGRTPVTADNTARLPSTRPDGGDRAPVKPGTMLEPLKPGEKRELTGAEIAIAAIVAAAGAARVRPEDVRIQRPSQPGDKDPATAAQDAAAPIRPDAIPIGFVPEFHVEGDAIALRGPAAAGDGVEKAALADADFVQDQTTAAPQSVLLRPTCLVSENDTLISIAEELFHDPNLGWLIADLNRGRIQERWEDDKRIVEVASRQELLVPVWQDIVDFYENRPEQAKPENLVTIVTQSQLDRELLNATLAKVVGSGTPAGPFAAPAATKTGSPQAPVPAPAGAAKDWKTRAAAIPKATAAALLAFSNRWPKPPAAPASDDIR